MAGRIRREDIERVRESIRIEDVVGEHVTLQPAGVGSLKGLCPFHDERTPSFHVRPALGLWHCFGCGEGGDVISFVEKIDHLEFADAVEYLAGRAGITLHYEEGGRQVRREEPGRRQRLLAAHRAAEDFYRRWLTAPEARAGRDFLSGRGFTPAQCERFGIGYAPKGWDNLLRHLRAQGFADQEILTAGLATQGSRGPYDRFRGRLVWPIRDVTGATIGFGARKLDEGEDAPKYLNTPETPIYHKAQVLYGLDLAKKDIARSHRVVIVEGYTDVMAAHAAGVTQAVATCGTAFGAEHVKVVRRLLGDAADPAAGVVLSDGHAHGGEVVFTFDGDAAGQKAALRAFREDQNFAAQTFVAVERSGMDPCELRQARGDVALRALVDSRVPLFQFVIRSFLSQVDLDTAEGRVRGLRAAAPAVARIKDRALRFEYTRQLAGWLGMELAEVATAVRRAEYEAGRPRHRAGESRPADAQQAGMSQAGVPAPAARRQAEDPVARIERLALEALLQRPGDVEGRGVEDLDAQAFTVPSYRAVHDAVRAIGGLRRFGEILGAARQAGAQGGQAVAQATRRWDEEVREAAGGVVGEVVTQLAVAPLPQDRPERLADYARGVVEALVRLDLTRRVGDLRAALQRMEPAEAGYREKFAALMDLEGRRRALLSQDA